MADLASLRAEIKGWERDFREKNGRNPSVDDIKGNPRITEKYKLYKKLSKESNSSSQSQSQSQKPALPKSRPVEKTAPLSSFNPFSPQKNKGKQPQSPEKTQITPRPTNPFATPLKNKQKAVAREPSPVPVPAPLPGPSTSSVVQPTQTQQDPPSAVVRARKRLRGEPVSPSPNKEKRRRVFTQSTLSFTRRNSVSSSEEDDGDEDDTFVGDSPVKHTTGSKSFKRLFEDAESPNSFQAALARAKSNNPSNGLFGKPTKDSSAISFDDEMDWEVELQNPKTQVAQMKVFNGRPRLPAKDNLHAANPQTSLHTSQTTEAKRPTRKRVISDASDGEHEKQPSTSLRSNPEKALIPPSPPPVNSSSSSKHTFKAKGKAAGRKKAKLEQANGDDDEDGTSSDGAGEAKVVRVRSYTRGAAPVGNVKVDDEDNPDLETDSDLILRYFRPTVNKDGGFTVFEGDEDYEQDYGSKEPERNEGLGTVEINLPDKLKNVLALSSDSRSYDTREELLADELLYGRRMSHYDAARGGEIWDIGDVSGDEQDGDIVKRRRHHLAEEDDWEAEPIPWEIGEL